MNESQAQIQEDAIRMIQTYLRHLSFHDENLQPLPIDGIWEQTTIDALRAFQRREGLPETGIVDRTTWDSLKAAYDESVARNSPPERIDLFPRYPRNYKTEPGEESFLVSAIQHILSELEQIYRFPALSFSGIYDDLTVRAVKEFQRRNNIPDSGDVTRETWDALALQHNLLI